MQDGYGPASLCEGIKAIEWSTKTRSPGFLINTLHMYLGNYVDAQLQVTSVIRDSPPYSFTFALDDTAQPQTVGDATFGCYYEVPEGVQNEVTGVITRVDCGFIGSGDCYFHIRADSINGRTCPITTPTETETPEPTVTETQTP